MQAIAPVTLADLESPLIVPLSKLELYYGGSWQTPQAIISDAQAILMNISTSMGAAEPTIYAVAGSWTAKVYNPDAKFHPLHPASAFTDVFILGRKVRISQGIKVGGTNYFWKTMYGIVASVDFDLNGNCVDISGMDYCQALIDYKLRRFLDLAFGGTRAFQIAAGPELVTNGGFTTNTVGWTPDDCWIASIAGGQSGNCMEQTDDGFGKIYQQVWQGLTGLIVGTEYNLICYVKSGTSGDEPYRVLIGTTPMNSDVLAFEGATTGAWVQMTATFVATETTLYLTLEKRSQTAGTMLWDTVSCSEVKKHRYPMDAVAYPAEAAATGAFLLREQLTSGPPPTWQDYFENESWTWDTAVPEMVFNDDFAIPAVGTWFNAYVFETRAPEDLVFYLLANCGLYAGYATAKAGSIYTATGITIDRVSFPPGTNGFQAIRQIAERCNYVFYFRYDGKPVFIPKPAIKAYGLEDLALLKNHVANVKYVKIDTEFFNSISLEGETQAHPISKVEAETDTLKGIASDAVSIAAYGEKNYPSKNSFWQTQAAINTAATTLLALLKDPKSYFPFDLIFCPIPIEWGDTVKITIDLPLIPGLGAFFGIADFGLCDFGSIGAGGLSVSVHGLVRSIKVNDFAQSAILELGA